MQRVLGCSGDTIEHYFAKQFIQYIISFAPVLPPAPGEGALVRRPRPVREAKVRRRGPGRHDAARVQREEVAVVGPPAEVS